MPQLKLFSYAKGSDLVKVQAYVEDAIQIAPATEFDEAQFGSALCETYVVWSEPITADNAPTHEHIERMLAWITDWIVVPPISFEDE